MDWLEGGVVVPGVELPGVTSCGVIIGTPGGAVWKDRARHAMRACKGREINSDSKRWIRLRCFKVIGAG